RDLACNVVVTGNAAIYSTFCQLREVLAKVPLLFLRVFPSAGNDRTLSFVLVLAGLRPLIFFFQAEDGIRDLIVTGVQTCALPICHAAVPHTLMARPRQIVGFGGGTFPTYGRATLHPLEGFVLRLTGRERPRVCYIPRSEERRVGKECRRRMASED